ncbi:MAG: DUF4384 domain-containing protein [Thermodesulfobacteriota bacterium]|nr:DUF4384 domain-containing protein [Thermodesulfobacteriota bacterium]
MRMTAFRKCSLRGPCAVLLLLSFSIILVSCGGMDPRKVEVEIEESAVEQKITSYTQALSDLGLMTEIYGTGIVRIQSEDIADQTGTSSSTGGEIQRNITEIMKSTLNSIGGNVIFIEYNPSYIQNQMVTGYSSFDDKLIPDVVITGGITEFDRGLETRGEGTDAAAEYEFEKAGSDLPSKKVGFDYSDGSKAGKARITLDFNMKDFQTLAGISKMNTVNSIEVHKAVREKELGVTIFGPTFGMKGKIKKVQGRHEAVRLLVQASMIQMVGKYLVMPYWRLLGHDNEPDSIITGSLERQFYTMSKIDQLVNIQEWLFLHGYDVDLTGVFDAKTEAALQQFKPGFNSKSIDAQTFIDIYTSIPLNNATLARRNMLAQAFTQAQSAPAAPAPVPAKKQAEAPKQQASSSQQPAAAAEQQAAQQPPPQPEAPPKKVVKKTVKKTKSIGRMLSDDEW